MTSFRYVRKEVFSPTSIYILRCITGFSAGYFLMLTFPRFDLFWALLSIVLVISPEGKDTARLSLERVKANLIGAFSSFLPVYLPFGTYYKVLAGIILAALLCRIFNLLSVARTAVVAIIIILIEKPNEGFMAPIDRFLSVLSGCVIGLLITLTTAYIIKLAYKRQLLIEYKLLR
ncbi:FUSC family protein [Chryseobacterium sp.]|uniref:FUSC family protein n=1 Tax=Chryseobacterium sp. TaxID=1871047 RepID=UPI0012A8CB75|nr:FUSC family protein [Chryseobacterium sp.]QFG52731.1 FUSC family protein [Chryseobacterium sp.]